MEILTWGGVPGALPHGFCVDRDLAPASIEQAIAEIRVLPSGSDPDTDPARVSRAWIEHLRRRGITEGRLLGAVTHRGQQRRK